MSRAGSPADRTPYEVLGVDPAADTATIRAAYRRLVRATHPDTGGEAHLFHAVQRAWELVGDPDDRAAYDRGQGRTTTADDDPLGPDDAGHYIDRVAEWQGVAPGTELGVDPWSPELVRRAPRDVRWLLAKALAEEATARAAASLGMGATIFHDVRPLDGQGKVDHVVLAPAGLFALSSEDWGTAVQLVRGELQPVAADPDGAFAPGDAPVTWLVGAARALAASAGVRFAAAVVVVPDDALAQPVERVERGRNRGALVVRRSVLPLVLRDGVSEEGRLSVADPYAVRALLRERLTLLGPAAG
ncbi:Curved DNA-binding protein [Clavibacter michiganensis subsp. michiganensis]|uniref:J domain-containing protein n=1 Tax=Clavibacter michiganensis TaxID=28447 RepID=UPI000B69E27D|nr:J domain-containing protein [Clavibacter michiganensis]OUE06975.1 Curved DNA-binding protein [Clavibacter michiganensis subsp. michiganensis]